MQQCRKGKCTGKTHVGLPVFLKSGSGYHAVRSETNDAIGDVVDKYNTNQQLKK